MLDTTVRIMDCSNDVTDTAAAIRQAGFTTVIRYYARNGGDWCGKTISGRELDALDAAGLSVVIVFQNRNDQADYFYDEQNKIDDVAAALSSAGSLGQPAGTAIYFAVDFDIAYRRKKDSNGNYYKDSKGDWVLETSAVIREANKDAVYSYFQYAKGQLPNYKLGVYGCGTAAELLGGTAERPRLVDFFWLSASTSYDGTARFYNSGRWHLFQNQVEVPSQLIPPICHDDFGRHEAVPASQRTIDTDLLNDSFEIFGQWRKDGSTPPHASAESKAILAGRAFCLRRPTTVFSAPDVNAAPVTNLGYAKNVRILEQRADGFVGVGLHEAGTVGGYCRSADLTTDLKSMPEA